MAIRVTPVRFSATDGFSLGGCLVSPNEPRATISLHSATAVRKEFYSHFARHLAEHGFAVLLFDYRGVGDSRPDSLKNLDARMQEWGSLDMPAALAWLKSTYPTHAAYIVAHSMGGQLIGLMSNHHLASGVITVAASTAYWRDLPMPYGLYTALVWYGLVPLTTRAFGYLPIDRLGLGEDLPRGVAKEWAQWCTTREYLRPHFGRSIARDYYRDLRLPLKAYLLEGDRIATRTTGPRIMEYYERCSVEIEYISREVAGGVPGHFGFFSRKFKDALWEKPLHWLEAQLVQRLRTGSP